MAPYRLQLGCCHVNVDPNSRGGLLSSVVVGIQNTGDYVAFLVARPGVHSRGRRKDYYYCAVAIEETNELTIPKPIRFDFGLGHSRVRAGSIGWKCRRTLRTHALSLAGRNPTSTLDATTRTRRLARESSNNSEHRLSTVLNPPQSETLKWSVQKWSTQGAVILHCPNLRLAANVFRCLDFQSTSARSDLTSL